jgi:uncharacterized protein (TIGR01777 family)
MNNTVLITGGTGLIGKALTRLLLEQGFRVIVLSRKAHQENTNGVRYATWNIKQQAIDIDALQEADYIVHLAGANVGDKRWTRKRKKEIEESRTQSSALLANALRENYNSVKAVVSASAIGWYGEDKGKAFVETDPAAAGFLGATCLKWEQSIEPVTALGKRLVKIRTGIVLSNEGGALAEFLKPIKFGIAAILGTGKQVISWIHIDDLCRIYLEAIQNEQLNGVYNAVATQPVTNKTLTLALAKAKRGKFFIPVHIPSFVLKLVLGEMSIEILKSATVSNEKIRRAGFKFIYPTLEAAINALMK